MGWLGDRGHPLLIFIIHGDLKHLPEARVVLNSRFWVVPRGALCPAVLSDK